MSSQMRVCPGSIGWVVVDQLAKRMYLRKNDGSIIKIDDIPAKSDDIVITANPSS